MPPQVESILPKHTRWREELEEEPDEVLPAPLVEPPPDPPAYIGASLKEPFWRRWFGARRSAAAPAESAPSAAVEREAPPQRKPISVRIKPIRRGVASEPRMGWISRLVAALLALGALVVVMLVAFPYDRYRPEVEQRASTWLGQPVSIGEVRFALTPRPGITLDRVRVGGEQGVVLGSARVLPAPFSLFGNKWNIGTVVLDRPLIDQRAILALFDSRRAPASDAIDIRRVNIEGATFSVAGMGLEEVSGFVDLTPEAKIKEIRLRTGDGYIRLTALPLPGHGLKLALSSAGWRMPWRGGIPMDFIEADGRLTRNALRVDKMEVRTLGGTISGSGSIEWQQQVMLSMQANYARIDLQRLLALVEPVARVQGSASGKIALRAVATSFESTGRALSGGGPFSIERCSLDGFDLVEAVRSRSDNPIRGGSTKLEELSGTILLDAASWRLSGLRGNSGVMSTAGYLHQSGGKVDGLMDVQLRGSANQVNVPVAIGGSLADPQLTARRRSGPPATGEAGQGAEEAHGR